VCERPGDQTVGPLQCGGVQLKQGGDVIAMRNGDQREGDFVGRLPLPPGEHRLRLVLRGTTTVHRAEYSDDKNVKYRRTRQSFDIDEWQT